MAFSKSWLDNLKIRAGWGQSGNDQIGNYNGFTTYTTNQVGTYYSITGSNTAASTGFEKATIGNPDARWETTTATNIGIDATFARNLSLTVDVWNRETTDMLYPKKIPQILGFATAPSINIGKMKNTGIDVELSYQGSALNKDFQYYVSLYVSHYKNKIIKLSGEVGDYLEGDGVRAAAEHAFPEFYGYIVDGFFQTQAEVDAYPPAFGTGGIYNQLGNFKYRDVNKDGVINDQDRTYIGSPNPVFTAGSNINLQYKGFRLTTQLYSSYGNKVFNQTRTFIDFHIYQTGHSTKTLYESWGSPYLKDNNNAKMPKVQFDDSGSNENSTYFIENGSYLRMQNLIIGYTFTKLLPKLNFNNLEIYGEVTNLFTLTKYSGLDPEIGRSGMASGTDPGSWPTPRRFIVGVNIDF